MAWNDSHLCSSWFLQVSHLGWGSVGLTLPPRSATGQIVWLPVSWGIGMTSTSPSSSGMLALGCLHRLPSGQAKLTRPLELSLWTSRGYFVHILMINESRAQPRAQQWINSLHLSMGGTVESSCKAWTTGWHKRRSFLFITNLIRIIWNFSKFVFYFSPYL